MTDDARMRKVMVIDPDKIAPFDSPPPPNAEYEWWAQHGDSQIHNLAVRHLKMLAQHSDIVGVRLKHGGGVYRIVPRWFYDDDQEEERFEFRFRGTMLSFGLKPQDTELITYILEQGTYAAPWLHRDTRLLRYDGDLTHDTQQDQGRSSRYARENEWDEARRIIEDGL